MEKKSNIDSVKCHIRFRLLVRQQLTCRDRNLPDKSTNYCEEKKMVCGLKHFIHSAVKNRPGQYVYMHSWIKLRSKFGFLV